MTFRSFKNISRIITHIICFSSIILCVACSTSKSRDFLVIVNNKAFVCGDIAYKVKMNHGKPSAKASKSLKVGGITIARGKSQKEINKKHKRKSNKKNNNLRTSIKNIQSISFSRRTYKKSLINAMKSTKTKVKHITFEMLKGEKDRKIDIKFKKDTTYYTKEMLRLFEYCKKYNRNKHFHISFDPKLRRQKKKKNNIKEKTKAKPSKPATKSTFIK